MAEGAAATKKLLFVAEAVTLAHVARPFALARSLPADRYRVVFAAHPRYRHLFPDGSFPWHPLQSISPQRFLGRLAKGRPPYDRQVFGRYLEEEFALLDAERPDLVVGDFRLTLAISCRKRGIPYLAIANAYWSPYADPHYPIPEHPSVALLGERWAERLFNRIAPLVFAAHTAPFNALCKAHGLPGVGRDLRRYYTEADGVLYADLPELVPLHDPPAHHHYLGPIAWAPEVAPPPWWERALAAETLVYVTPGSSGLAAMLPKVVEAAASLPITLVMATAGLDDLPELPDNVFAAPYLPGDRLAAKAALVVCNGGSPTTYQALTAGTPVIGVPTNLDQYLNMKYVQAAGAGITLRAGRLTADGLLAAIQKLLADDQARRRARRLQQAAARWPAERRFVQLIETFER